MYTLKQVGDKRDFVGGPLYYAVIEDWQNTPEFDQFIHVPTLVYFDGDIGNMNPSTFALLVYIDGDSNWNIVVVPRDFDIQAFTDADESDAMISGPGYPALKTDEGRVAMELIYLVGRWNHYDVVPIAGC